MLVGPTAMRTQVGPAAARRRCLSLITATTTRYDDIYDYTAYDTPTEAVEDCAARSYDIFVIDSQDGSYSCKGTNGNAGGTVVPCNDVKGNYAMYIIDN
jgi:hypothetical protein